MEKDINYMNNKETNIANEEKLKEINQRSKNSLIERLGIIYTYASSERVEAEMPVDERTLQPEGLLHGGASLALAESIAGMGSRIGGNPNDVPLGMQVSGNHISPVKAGEKVKATATIIHRGNMTHIWNVNITTMEGRLVSSVRVVNCIVKKK